MISSPSPGAHSSFYLSFFGLQTSPFNLSPQPDYFFGGGNREQALQQILHFAKCGEGVAIVSGEIGCGKTMLLTMLIREIAHTTSSGKEGVASDSDLSYIVPLLINSMILSPADLAKTIANQLDIKNEAPSQPQQYAIEQKLIELFAQGQRTMLIIDEAHTMSDECLEWVRLLSNLETDQGKMLQILLFAQPEILPRLASEKLRALTDRITMNIALRGLNQTETQHYLDHRLRRSGYRGDSLFLPEAIALLAKESKGRSRRIHVLADKAVLAAYLDFSSKVSVDHVKRAIHDTFNPLMTDLYQPILESSHELRVDQSPKTGSTKKRLSSSQSPLSPMRWLLSILPVLVLLVFIVFLGYSNFSFKDIWASLSSIGLSAISQTTPSVSEKPIPKNKKQAVPKVFSQPAVQKKSEPVFTEKTLKIEKGLKTKKHNPYHLGIFFDWPEASHSVQQWLKKSQQYFFERDENEWFLRIVSVDANPKRVHKLREHLNAIGLPTGQYLTAYRFKNKLRIIVLGFSDKTQTMQAIPIWQKALRGLIQQPLFYTRPITSLYAK